CIPYVGAVALLNGAVGLADFAPAALRDPAIRELAQRISVAVDGNPDRNALRPQRVEVTLRNGTRHAAVMPQILGHPERPLSRERHLMKFRACWRASGLPAEHGERVTQAVDRLETIADVTAVIGPLTGSVSGRRSATDR